MIININEYIEGKRKSLGAELKGKRFIAGVILSGRLSFNTDQEEHIDVNAGALNILYRLQIHHTNIHTVQ
jgi:uncharacterized protein YaiE (UPF0345 family)